MKHQWQGQSALTGWILGTSADDGKLIRRVLLRSHEYWHRQSLSTNYDVPELKQIKTITAFREVLFIQLISVARIKLHIAVSVRGAVFQFTLS